MAIIVGDIHGNLEKVQAFLGYKPEEEHVALGDYVDSFTEPVDRQVEALQLLIDSDAVLLWGNHDLHYLATPPFLCTGYQYKHEQVYRALIEANKRRFLAAYVADGWLCTHAGVHIRLAKREDESTIAARLNKKMAEYLDKPSEPGQQGIFAIGGGRGGESRCGGIFWFDFKRENGLDSAIKQIFGHTETREPVVTQAYVALDTTNCADTCYLYDTETNEIVKLKLPRRATRPEIDFGDEDVISENGHTPETIEERRAGMNDADYAQAKERNTPQRINDLPPEEQEPFSKYLYLKSVPFIGGYWPTDYRQWKAGVEARKRHALEHYPRERDLPVEERGPFREWMMGQTRPYVEGIPQEDQDFYYEEDYRRWKAGLEPFD